jgi:PAS domain S-box-containing protein
MTAGSILIVASDQQAADQIAVNAGRLGCSAVSLATSASEALELVRVARPDLTVVDLDIEDSMPGFELAHRLHQEHDVPVILLTADVTAQVLNQAAEIQPLGCLPKPLDARALATTLKTALRRRQAEQKLTKMEQWLAATMTSIGDGVIATNPEGQIFFMNPVAERLCAFPNGSALGKSLPEVFRISGAACTDLAALMAKAAAHRAIINLDECELERADGSRIPIDDSLAPIRDSAGRVIGLVVVFRDATERKRHDDELHRLNEELEQRVQRRTAQLEAANGELSSFAYSIAHDLRAPLRVINGFASRVAQEHASSLDAEGRRLLSTVASQAVRMAQMIDDYLRLSRLGHVSLARRPVDMTQLASEAWALVTSGVEKPPNLQLDELPRVLGDLNLIRQVWVNVLSNAVKFTRTTGDPQVCVSGRIENGTARYVVEDNGVGFPASPSSKPFRVFERMHRQDEFEGSGIGLCIVQRVLHRHEGDVTIKAKPGRGARVEFWLPCSSDCRAAC